MIKTDECPWAAKVKRSLIAPLSEEEMEAVSGHVEQCPVCREVARGPSRLDRLGEELRRASAEHDEAMVDIVPPAAKLDEILEDYEILGELGRGGMGVVYRARQLKLNRIVALKVLPMLLAAIRPETLKRFQREASLAASLKHSNIISVYDFGDVDGTMFYVMELVDGMSLRTFIERVRDAGGLEAASRVVASSTDATAAARGVIDAAGRNQESSRPSRGNPVSLYIRQVAKWIADVADAVQYAHDRGIIHRDIKPANLLLSRDGRLMVSDFGLAYSSDGSLTLTKSVLGTSRYMGPECLDSSLGESGRCSDVYALGATLYELLTLRPMVSGSDDREVLQHVLHGEPRPPRSVAKSIPHELETICLTATAKRPEERYKSAGELGDDLRRWLLDLPIFARRPAWPVRAARYVKRRKLTVGLFAALVVAVLGAGIVSMNFVQAQQREAAVRQRSLHHQVQLLTRLGQDAYWEGKYREALEQYDKALSLNIEPRDPVGLKASRAWLISRIDGREDEAVAILRRLTEEHTDAIVAPYYLVLVLHNRGEVEEALAYAALLKKRDPHAPMTYLAHAALETDHYRALELINQAQAEGGDRYLCMRLRAARYRELGNFEAMLTETTGMVAKRENFAQSHFWHGRALLHLHRLGDAEAAFSRAIELDPSAPRAWHLRSVTRSAQGKHAEAHADISRAIGLDERKEMLLARARARRGMADLEGALADCNRAMELDPDFVKGLLERHKVLAAMGRWKEAVSNADRAIEIAPDDRRAYGDAVVALVNLGRHDRALPYATKYAEVAPDDALGHRNRGGIYIKLGMFENAIPDFTAAIRLEPDDSYSYLQRAQCYLHTRRPEAALSDLARVEELQPGRRGTYIFRAIGFWMLGLEEMAREELIRMGNETPSNRPIAILWKYLLSEEPDERVREMLRVGAEQENRTWIHMAAAYIVGHATEEELLDYSVTSREQCAAFAFVATRALLEGDQARAQAYFQRSMDTGELQAFEFVLAKEQLRRLSERDHSVP